MKSVETRERRGRGDQRTTSKRKRRWWRNLHSGEKEIAIWEKTHRSPKRKRSREDDYEIVIWLNAFIFFIESRNPTFLVSKAPSGSSMTGWVLSECGLKPLPLKCLRPRVGTSPYNSPSKFQIINTNKSKGNIDMKFSASRFSSPRSWELKVSAPASVSPVEEVIVNEGNEFDPGAPPSFKLSDVREAIPKHCWVKDPWRSMSYVVRDVVVVFGLVAAAAYLNNWFVWPLYWAAQGTMFWALFVLGHDCCLDVLVAMEAFQTIIS